MSVGMTNVHILETLCALLSCSDSELKMSAILESHFSAPRRLGPQCELLLALAAVSCLCKQHPGVWFCTDQGNLHRIPAQHM